MMHVVSCATSCLAESFYVNAQPFFETVSFLFLANFLKKCKALKIRRKFKELFSKYPWIYPPNLTDGQSLGYIWFRWILWTKTPKVQLKCLLVSSPPLSLKSVCFLHIHVFILSTVCRCTQTHKIHRIILYFQTIRKGYCTGCMSCSNFSFSPYASVSGIVCVDRCRSSLLFFSLGCGVSLCECATSYLSFSHLMDIELCL